MQPNDLVKIHTLLEPFEITSDQIQVEETEELIKISINMGEEEAGRLIGRFAQTLDSLQLVLSLMLNQNRERRHVLLDVAGYRQRRLETLEAMVSGAKEQITRTGAPCALPPLSSTERRQVHLMLQDDENFTTYSEGEGQARRLYVAPKSA